MGLKPGALEGPLRSSHQQSWARGSFSRLHRSSLGACGCFARRTSRRPSRSFRQCRADRTDDNTQLPFVRSYFLVIVSPLARKQSSAIVYYLVGSDEIHYFGTLEVVFGGRTSLHRYDSFGVVRRWRSGRYSKFGVFYVFIVCGVCDFLI